MSGLHTPWIAREYGSPKGRWFVRNSNNETINYPLTEGEAFLFAAAPDLLAALTDLEESVSGRGFIGLQDALGNARAAIARATPSNPGETK